MPTVTLSLWLAVTPVVDVPLRVTVQVPAESYVCDGLRDVELEPSPNDQVHVAALRDLLANETVRPFTA